MANIQKRPTSDGTVVYRVRIRRKGAPMQTATFTRLTDAKNWAKQMEGAVLDGRHFTTAEAKKHTLADLVDRYIRDVLPRKSASSLYMQRLQLTWWKTQIGPRLLRDITPPLLAEYREKLARGDGTPRASATVVRYLAALSHAFSVAVREWQWVEVNPVLKVSRPKEPRGRERYLTDEERERLLAACKASRNRSLYTIVVLALSTGARKMELCRLTWPDVDLRRGAITLRHTKNGDTRVLPLTGLALDLLRQRSKVRRLDTPLVFPNPTGRQPGCIRTAYLNAVRQAGIADFHFHDLRHSAASYLAMHGAGLAEIADILGHRSLEMAWRYTHLTEQHNAKVLDTMTTALFGARASRPARV